jgi:hypothetical protein
MKILVACPIWEVDKRFVENYCDQAKGYDILFIENTPWSDEFYEELKQKGHNVIKHHWNPKETYMTNMLADCRNMIIKYVLEHDYTHWMWLDVDTSIPLGAIAKLAAHDKDIVGIPTNLSFKNSKHPLYHKPAVWLTPFLTAPDKSNKLYLNVCKWSDLKGLMRVHCISGTVLIKRKVLEKCKFTNNPDKIWGEDLWFFTDCARAKFEFWCDATMRAHNSDLALNKKRDLRNQYEFDYYLKWRIKNKGSLDQMLTSFAYSDEDDIHPDIFLR